MSILLLYGRETEHWICILCAPSLYQPITLTHAHLHDESVSSRSSPLAWRRLLQPQISFKFPRHLNWIHSLRIQQLPLVVLQQSMKAGTPPKSWLHNTKRQLWTHIHLKQRGRLGLALLLWNSWHYLRQQGCRQKGTSSRRSVLLRYCREVESDLRPWHCIIFSY